MSGSKERGKNFKNYYYESGNNSNSNSATSTNGPFSNLATPLLLPQQRAESDDKNNVKIRYNVATAKNNIAISSNAEQNAVSPPRNDQNGNSMVNNNITPVIDYSAIPTTGNSNTYNSNAATVANNTHSNFTHSYMNSNMSSSNVTNFNNSSATGGMNTNYSSPGFRIDDNAVINNATVSSRIGHGIILPKPFNQEQLPNNKILRRVGSQSSNASTDKHNHSNYTGSYSLSNANFNNSNMNVDANRISASNLNSFVENTNNNNNNASTSNRNNINSTSGMSTNSPGLLAENSTTIKNNTRKSAVKKTLLNQDNEEDSLIVDDDFDEIFFPDDPLKTVLSITNKLIVINKYALPNVWSFLLLLLPEIINVFFISHYAHDPHSSSTTKNANDNNYAGSDSTRSSNTRSKYAQDCMAAVGLGNCVLNCLGLAVGIGLNQALDTFISTSYGAKNFKAVFVYLGRAMVIVLLYWPMAVFFFFLTTEFLLLKLGQDPEVTRLSADYCQACVWGLLPCFLSDTYRKFFANIGQTSKIGVAQFFVTTFHIFWCYFFVGYWELDNFGLGLANNVTWTTYLLLFHIVFWKTAETFWTDVYAEEYLALNNSSENNNERSSIATIHNNNNIHDNNDESMNGGPLDLGTIVNRNNGTTINSDNNITYTTNCNNGILLYQQHKVGIDDDNSIINCTYTALTDDHAKATTNNHVNNDPGSINNVELNAYCSKRLSETRFLYFLDVSDKNIWSFAVIFEYLEIAVPACANTIAEWLFWEILAIIAGMISPLAQACHVAALNCYLILFNFPLGIASTVAQLVGQSLGEGRPKLAKSYTLFSWAYISIVSCFVVAFGAYFRDDIVRFYIPDSIPDSNDFSSSRSSKSGTNSNTNSSANSNTNSSSHDYYTNDNSNNSKNSLSYEQNLLAQLLNLVFYFCYLPDALQNVANGTLRSCGMNEVGAKIYFVQHYVLGISLALYWGLHYDSVLDMWWALVVDLVCGCSVTLWIIYFRINWELESDKAIARSAKQNSCNSSNSSSLVV